MGQGWLTRTAGEVAATYQGRAAAGERLLLCYRRGSVLCASAASVPEGYTVATLQRVPVTESVQALNEWVYHQLKTCPCLPEAGPSKGAP